MTQLNIAFPTRIRTILCPVSLREDGANWTVRVAYSLAREHGAELVLLHVVSTGAECEYELAKAGEQRLFNLQAELPGVRARTLTAWGDPASAIVRATGECDFLVMRPSRASWLVGRWVDSLSQRVCRLARCRVVLIDQGNSKLEHATQLWPRERACSQPSRQVYPRVYRGLKDATNGSARSSNWEVSSNS